MSTEGKILVDEFRRNSQQVVRVHLQRWKERRYFDIRVYEYSEGPTGDFNERGFEGTPTRKGITLDIYLLEQFIEGVLKIRERLEREKEELERRSPF